MLRGVLCDDEPLALDRLTDMVGRTSAIEVVGTATNGHAALAAISEHRPDVAFLDIEMPGLDGFDVVEQLARSGAATPLVVFVTAYPEFAAHAFDSGAIDFLTKPVRLGRLETALDRVRRAIDDRSAQARLDEIVRQIEHLRHEREAHTQHDRHLWVAQRGETVRVDLDAIVWIQAEGEYVRLHLETASYLHREPISALVNRLDPARYVRIHRSYIVDRDRVVSVRRRPAGGYVVRIGDGLEIPVGRSYRGEARALAVSRHNTPK
ncbi:MAG TPA: LytTR family DNA-binding domain-containing protein [Sphingomonas sp.]|nr:LytTR family DNA-binding domain-containing protein [Sphingomonas sp.]